MRYRERFWLVAAVHDHKRRAMRPPTREDLDMALRPSFRTTARGDLLYPILPPSPTSNLPVYGMREGRRVGHRYKRPQDRIQGLLSVLGTRRCEMTSVIDGTARVFSSSHFHRQANSYPGFNLTNIITFEFQRVLHGRAISVVREKVCLDTLITYRRMLIKEMPVKNILSRT